MESLLVAAPFAVLVLAAVIALWVWTGADYVAPDLKEDE